MTNNNPLVLIPGTLVQHFKRELLTIEDQATSRYTYEILGVATHTETEEELVIYRALYGDKKTYARPKDMFLSPVDREKYPEGKQEYRFAPLENL